MCGESGSPQGRIGVKCYHLWDAGEEAMVAAAVNGQMDGWCSE